MLEELHTYIATTICISGCILRLVYFEKKEEEKEYVHAGT